MDANTGGVNWRVAGTDTAGTNITWLNALSLAVNGNATFSGSGGTCTINGSGACTSDARLKEHIAKVDGADALKKLSLISPITYDWIDPALDQRERIGVLAQDVSKVFPQLVGEATTTFMGKEGSYLTVDYAGLVAPLISAVQELARGNDRQDERLDALEKRVERLEKIYKPLAKAPQCMEV
jgi:hypothetical protein